MSLCHVLLQHLTNQQTSFYSDVITKSNLTVFIPTVQYKQTITTLKDLLKMSPDATQILSDETAFMSAK